MDLDAVAKDFENALRARIEGYGVTVTCAWEPEHGWIAAFFKRRRNGALTEMEIAVSEHEFELSRTRTEDIASVWAEKVLDRLREHDEKSGKP